MSKGNTCNHKEYLSGISLFSNCGAGDLGYRKAGFRFDVMAELDPRRLEVCILNHPEAEAIPGDLRETWTEVLSQYRARSGNSLPDLLAACPPCQGVSSARGDRGKGNDPDSGMKDKRNLLAVVIAEVAIQLQPRIVVVENVPAFLTRKVRHPETQKAISAASLLISMLKADYEVFPILTDLCDYGVPQTRRRTFLTFIHKEVATLSTLNEKRWAPFPLPTHAKDYGNKKPIQLQEALQQFNLPSLDACSEATAMSNVVSGLHSVPIWKDRRYDMVAAIPPNSGASAWENVICANCGKVNAGDEEVLCPICEKPLLRPVVEEKDGTYRLIKGFRHSSYRRMRPDEPASAILTASGHLGSHYTIHPFENRVLSPLECAYLQTFPVDFKWGKALERWGHTNIRVMIGEAVPPLFTQLHGEVLIKILIGKWSQPLISMDDPRCTIARKKLRLREGESLSEQLSFLDS